MTPEDFLFEVEREMKKRGHGDMDAPTLKEAYNRIKVPHVWQMIQGGQVTPQLIAEESDRAIKIHKQKKSGGGQYSGLPLGQSMVPGQQTMLPSMQDQLLNPDGR